MSRDWQKDLGLFEEGIKQARESRFYPTTESSPYQIAIYWLQQYAEVRDDAVLLREQLARINCDYYADKQRFLDRGRELEETKGREQKLMEAIDKAIREYGLWHDEGSAANVMAEILHYAVASLYPKEETK